MQLELDVDEGGDCHEAGVRVTYCHSIALELEPKFWRNGIGSIITVYALQYNVLQQVLVCAVQYKL